LTEHGQLEHLGAVRDIFDRLDVPTHVVIGNHDYGPGDDRRAYDKVFPGRINYGFRHRDWQFVGLDTSDGLRYEKTRIHAATLHWVDRHLHQLALDQPTVIFTHFPMGDGVTYRPLNADALLQRFLPCNLQAVYCGHFHGFTEKHIRGAAVTTNQCCALKRGNHDNTTAKGFFLCTAANGRVTRELIEVPPA
jgi:hypothetical protein